jgi:hypothetical protein
MAKIVFGLNQSLDGPAAAPCDRRSNCRRCDEVNLRSCLSESYFRLTAEQQIERYEVRNHQ